jgi:hypothetical protein
MAATNEVLLAYMAWMDSPSDNMATGGLLVTNHHGVPIEFRYTDPVRLSDEQRLLYREDRRSEAVAATIAESLWQATEQRPIVLLAEDFRLVSWWDEHAMGARTLLVCLEVAPDDSLHFAVLPRVLVLPVEAGQPCLARAHVLSDWDDAPSVAERLLGLASEKMRLDEPFGRVEKVLRAIHGLPESQQRERRAPGTRTAPLTAVVQPQPAQPRRHDGARRAAACRGDAFSSEAIADRLRRFGAHNDALSERFRRLRGAREQEERLPVRAGHALPAHGAVAATYARLAPAHDEDTDLDRDGATRRRPEDVRRWRERFALHTTDDPLARDAEEALRPAERARPEAERDVPAAARAGALRARADLQWMFRDNQPR